MADAHVFRVPRNIARGYEIPAGKSPLANYRRNGAGVTAIMGLTNGVGAAERARRSKRARKACRDDAGKFAFCDVRGYRRNEAEPNRRRSRSSSIRSKRGGATCWKKPRAKYVALGATRRSDYAYPECWAYPINSRQPKWRRRLVPRAQKWFAVHGDKYAPAVRKKISGRISRAAKQLGLRGGSHRARPNTQQESSMIVLENRGRRRRSRRGRKSTRRAHGRRSVFTRRRQGYRRNEGLEGLEGLGLDASSNSSDEGGLDLFSANGHRRRGRKSSKQRGRGKRRSWRVARSYGRGSSRRRRGKAKRWGVRRSSKKRGRGRRSYRRNPPLSAAQRSYLASARAARGMYGDLPAASAAREAHIRRMRSAGQLRRMMARPTPSWGMSSILPPWARPIAARRARATAERKARKAQRLAMAMPAVMRGLGPRDLTYAMHDMTKRQIERLFPDYWTYRTFMKSARTDRRFRKYSSRFGGGGKRRRSFGRKRSFGRRRGRGRARRFGSRRSRFGRRWGRKYRRNSPFASTGSLLAAGGVGLGTYAVIQIAKWGVGKYSPIGGSLTGLVLGLAAAFASDKVFANDTYAKASAIAGIISMLTSAGSALLTALKPASGSALLTTSKPASGYGAVQNLDTTSRYRQMGAFQQAAAGFQQAAAGMGEYNQAQAGPGEYYQAQAGLGEYVSNDGSLSPVSDFGEYVASQLQVEGYGDYEVSPTYTPGADGFGMVNEGVHPGANMDNEFSIMEAAAGLGASVQTASDYIPTGGAQRVGSQGSSPDAGIFDVGGSNGVFG